ncbi:MAG: LLM class flavin-dependent oxidoreductase [Porticoccaceae bacterium]|nr:LLM class flavin-dependent oxidoreductase [Porticoccaceae bacterium]
MVPLSVLDLSPIIKGSNAAEALGNTLDLAQHAECWGYQRYWLAEHHNMPGIASAATAIVIGHVAAGTSTIRVGAGGIMLPNHSPLVIAEQFGTLESLFPGRIDLGLGRAPGSDQITAQALRRNLALAAEHFPQDVMELIHYFKSDDAEPGAPKPVIQAVPGTGLEVPVWILGSSLFGAQLAAHLGLPYAFASHFAPTQLMQAIDIYRNTFKPSEHLAKPHVMLGFNVFAADTTTEAHYLASSMQQAFINLRKGQHGQLLPPIKNFTDTLNAAEQGILDQALMCSTIGTYDTIAEDLRAFVKLTSADELMLTSQVFDHQARLRSYEITASAFL